MAMGQNLATGLARPASPLTCVGPGDGPAASRPAQPAYRVRTWPVKPITDPLGLNPDLNLLLFPLSH
jgi:hypothetical protein